MFSFDHLLQSDDNTLSCNCTVTGDMPFFNGHFPGIPLMPAVAQLEMLQALIGKHAPQGSIIAGGDRLKFSGRIQPNDLLTIKLQFISPTRINFSVENHAGLASKGTLQVMENTRD